MVTIQGDKTGQYGQMPDGCGKVQGAWFYNSRNGTVKPSTYGWDCGTHHKPEDHTNYADWYCTECLQKAGLMW